MLRSMQSSSQQASICHHHHNFSQHHQPVDEFDSLRSTQSITLMSQLEQEEEEHNADDGLRESEFESSGKNDGSVSMDFDPEICDMETL